MASITAWARGLVRPIAEKLGEDEEHVARSVVVNFTSGIAEGITKLVFGPVFEKIVLELLGGLAATILSLYVVKDGELKKDLFEYGIRLLSDLPDVDVGSAALLKSSLQRALELAKQGRYQEALALIMQRPLGGVEGGIAAPPVQIPVEVGTRPQPKPQQPKKEHVSAPSGGIII